MRDPCYSTFMCIRYVAIWLCVCVCVRTTARTLYGTFDVHAMRAVVFADVELFESKSTLMA